MSKIVNNNDVDIYFKNLILYIDSNYSGQSVNFLKETKFEMLYLLLKNSKCIEGSKILSNLFILRLNETIAYCDVLENKLLLNEVINKNIDPTYEQMVKFLKRIFVDEVDEFDINGGIYWFAVDYHDGQFSNLYRAIGQTQYKPGAMEKGPIDFSVYRALVNEFASVKFDVGGKHDDLPPGEHYELPPGIKENKKNMNENKISIHEVKNLINEVIAETLQQEVGAVDYNDYEPIASKDDFAGDKLDDLRDTVDNLIAKVKNDTDDSDVAYDRLVSIHTKLSDAIRNPRLSSGERKQLEHDYEGILGLIHSIVGGGGAAEKFYVNEVESKPLIDKNRLLIIKWCESMGCRKAAIRMIDSILKNKLGLGTDDLSDTSTFADGIDSVEQALEQNDYVGAFNLAYDTAQQMIEDEGGDGLFEGSKNKFAVYYQVKNFSSVSKSGGWRIAASFGDKLAAEKFANDSENKQEYGPMYVDTYDSEYHDDDLDESLSKCGCWEEATKHPMFKEAVLSEKAPPGMENWIKSNKQRFKHQYGDKKGIGALYATAWKMFYKNKNK